jgi:hypothetical protein
MEWQGPLALLPLKAAHQGARLQEERQAWPAHPRQKVARQVAEQ